MNFDVVVYTEGSIVPRVQRMEKISPELTVNDLLAAVLRESCPHLPLKSVVVKISLDGDAIRHDRRLESLSCLWVNIFIPKAFLRVVLLNMGTNLESSNIFSPESSITLRDVMPSIHRNHASLLALYCPIDVETDVSLDVEQINRIDGNHVFLRSERVQWVYIRLRVVEPTRYLDVPPPEPTLENQRLAFVDRSICVYQLLINHHSNECRRGTVSKFHTKRHSGPGLDWMYPICINDYGSGKSSFADNYILSLRRFTELAKQYPILEKYEDFANRIKDAIYIRVNFQRNMTIEEIETQSHESIRAALFPLLSNPEILDQVVFGGSLADYIQDIFQFLDKPMFLVFDEIGAPFAPADTSLNASNEDKTRHKILFNSFVGTVIEKLLMQPHLFILLCGKAPFLDWVGANPEGKTPSSASRVRAERIVLNMIRPDRIVEILCKTSVKTTEGSIASFLGLDTDHEALRNYAEELYERTGGHPRSLAYVLHSRWQQIMNLKIPQDERRNFVGESSEIVLREEDQQLIKQAALSFRKSTCDLVKAIRQEGGLTDLPLEVTQIDPTTETGTEHRFLLPALRIGYKEVTGEANAGTKKSFRLTIPRNVLTLLCDLVLPLEEYLVDVLTSISKGMSIDFGSAFEKVVMKGFTQMTDMSSFLGTPLLGTVLNQGFRFSQERQVLFPKVTLSSSFMDPYSLTIHPDYAAKAVDRIYQDGNREPAWLLPLPRSSSPDLIHVCDVSEQRILLLIAVKNYSQSTVFAGKDLEDEIQKAQTMIEPDEAISAFLIVACTNYCNELQRQFANDKPWCVIAQDRKRIKEVILLDLSTPDRRAAFFQCKDVAAKGLEALVSKKKPLTPSAESDQKKLKRK